MKEYLPTLLIMIVGYVNFRIVEFAMKHLIKDWKGFRNTGDKRK